MSIFTGPKLSNYEDITTVEYLPPPTKKSPSGPDNRRSYPLLPLRSPSNPVLIYLLQPHNLNSRPEFTVLAHFYRGESNALLYSLLLTLFFPIGVLEKVLLC
ncbi:hypothetical protein ACH5RR_041691 [Cinchona calisaya]|uniref:Uncharacterized protein n=1 Tax=Cinchona calisaya TaxID=153742 RepID=A0ABD2XUA4_9GENT